MGHLHQYRQGTRSTKKPTIAELMNEEHEPDIKLKAPRRILDRKHKVGIQVFSFEELKRTIATDQMDVFLILADGEMHTSCACTITIATSSIRQQ